MKLWEELQSYSGQPLTHQLLMSVLKDYKRPNDKIHALLREGVLEYIKKGLYVAGPTLKVNRPEPFLLANHILGPSYVSLESALSYYGFIPERVYAITSITIKATRKFETPMGVFSYIRLPLPYYSFGIQQSKLSDQQYAMMASPEKALCDKVVTTSGLQLRTKKNAMSYLIDDLRMERDNLKELNMKAISEWLPYASKKATLEILIKTINSL